MGGTASRVVSLMGHTVIPMTKAIPNLLKNHIIQMSKLLIIQITFSIRILREAYNSNLKINNNNIWKTINLIQKRRI